MGEVLYSDLCTKTQAGGVYKFLLDFSMLLLLLFIHNQTITLHCHLLWPYSTTLKISIKVTLW